MFYIDEFSGLQYVNIRMESSDLNGISPLLLVPKT